MADISVYKMVCKDDTLTERRLLKMTLLIGNITLETIWGSLHRGGFMVSKLVWFGGQFCTDYVCTNKLSLYDTLRRHSE